MIDRYTHKRLWKKFKRLFKGTPPPKPRLKTYTYTLLRIYLQGQKERLHDFVDFIHECPERMKEPDTYSDR